jgi:homoserine kinase
MVKVRVPATTANMGPCFDTMGMAVQGIYNYVEMEEIKDGLEINIEGEGKDDIPADKTNIVYKAISEIINLSNKKIKGLKINLKNEIPVARGMGSSASAIVGGLAAANNLFGDILSEKELLNLAVKCEGHPDNVAPALLGQIVISAEVDNKIIYRQIEPPNNLNLVIAVPEFHISTEDAREVLPEKYSRKDAVNNISHSSLLVWSLINNDFSLMGKMMDGDKIHQNYRKSLVPGMDEVFRNAKENGAFGVALSGAGPSIIAFCNDEKKVEKIGEKMINAFKINGLKSRYYTALPGVKGAEIIKT